MTEDLIKIAVLEQKIIDLKEVILKVDDAIDKISQVNINLTKMIAVHENKIESQQEKNESLEKKIDYISDRMERDHNNVLSEIKTLSKTVESFKGEVDDRISKVETGFSNINLKIGFAVTAFVLVGFVIQNAGFFAKFLAQDHLTNPQPSATINAPK